MYGGVPLVDAVVPVATPVEPDVNAGMSMVCVCVPAGFEGLVTLSPALPPTEFATLDIEPAA